jgi:lipopolysaccharide transport system permease protein
MARSLWSNRALIAALTWREVAGRYRGSFMGILWSLFHPVFMLAVYTFVFGSVFQVRWPSGNGSRAEFALVLFAGLLTYNLFAECVNRAPQLVVGNVNFVKKVVFPLEVLPVCALGAALFHAGVSLVVWLLFYVAIEGAPRAEMAFLPFIFLPLLLFTAGLSWALAALGVYFRDVVHIVGVLTTALMFCSPVFFPVSALPADLQGIATLNPLAGVIEQARAAMMWGHPPDGRSIAVQTLFGAAVAWLGFAAFQKARRGFADVL